MATRVSGEEEEEQKYLETLQKAVEERKTRNKTEFGDQGEHARLQLEGYRQGLYVPPDAPLSLCPLRTSCFPPSHTD